MECDYIKKYLEIFEIISDEHDEINKWIRILIDEGYQINKHAKELLDHFGGLKIKGKGLFNDKTEVYFNPVYFASGEIDRLQMYNKITDDVLFPVGGLYDYTIYVGQTGKIYIVDWKNIYECSTSIDGFLKNILSYNPKLKELYNG